MKAFNKIIIAIALVMVFTPYSHGQEPTIDVPANQTTLTAIKEFEGPIFQIVEEMPEFPGGSEKMNEFIANKLNYPQEAREKGVQGKVFVNFVIEPDGSISNIQVRRSMGAGCDEEAIRVIQSMPKWKPGKQRGNVVRVSYILPVIFKL